MPVANRPCSVAALLFGLAAGCSHQGASAPPATGDSPRHTDEDQATFRASMEKQLADIDAEIEKLKARSAKAAADGKQDVKVATDKTLEELRVLRDDLERAAKTVGNAASESWADARKGFVSAYDKLKARLKNAQEAPRE
jgi:molecular chaperone GrpE (heat shock protein)